MKNRYIPLLISALCWLCACQDDLSSRYEADENLSYLPFDYEVIDEAPGLSGSTTRAAGRAVSQEVKNLWVFQFSGVAENSVLVTTPRYLPYSKDMQVGVVPSTAPVRLLFIANTNSASINWKAVRGVTTYADVLKVSDELFLENEITGHENENVLMCGTVDGAINTATTLTPELYSSLARINLSLTVESVNYEVVSVKLHNVPTQVFWADYLRQKLQPNQITPAALESRFIAYADAEPNRLKKGDAERTYTWYMPSNARGAITGTASAQKDKNKWAFPDATFIEIFAVSNKEGDGGRYYRIYPGEDLTNDFNIRPNFSYDLKFKITDKTAADDSRIVEVKKEVTFAEGANSYLLNPPNVDAASAIAYYIPVLIQPNRFFEQATNYDVLRKGAFAGFLNSSHKWTCKVIWCDNPDLLASGGTAESIDKLYIATSSGDGSSGKGYMKVVVPPLKRNQHGSVHVGLYDGGGVCRWSYLLWVTDYNPDIPVTVEPYKFTYAVPGGQVERYASKLFGYEDSPKDPVYTKVYKETVGHAFCYRKSYSMDRFLGARVAYGDRNEAGGHFYQYGRKDPFEVRRTIYDDSGKKCQYIDGSGKTNDLATYYTSVTGSGNAYKWNNTAANTANGAYRFTMSDAIANPTMFYTGGGPWLGTTSANSTPFEDGTSRDYYVWSDPTLPMTVEGVSTWNVIAKSLFDPCPPGWSVGLYFGGESPYNDFKGDNAPRVQGKFSPRGLYHAGKHGMGCYYWPTVKKEPTINPVEGTIYFPAIGYIDTYGALAAFENSTDSGVYIWLNRRGITTGSQYAMFNYYDTVYYKAMDSYRTMGQSVRCIKVIDPR